MNFTTRFTYLLGECRRQMNGAVAGSMRYYGKKYGLNYGVSLPTIRQLAADEGKDHAYSCFLYQQEVREIRLAALHIAEAKSIKPSEMQFWANGIINTEIAEEASFALFQHVDSVAIWLDAEEELLQYTALLSIAKSKSLSLVDILPKISNTIEKDSMLLASAIIILLEKYYNTPEEKIIIDNFISQLSESRCSQHVRTELEWRIQ